MAGGAPSLFLTLALRLAAVTGALVLILLAVLAWRFSGQIDDLHDSSLTRQAMDVARYLIRSGDGLRLVLPAELEHSYASMAESGRARFAVLGQDGVLVAASPGVAAPLDPSHVSLPPEAREFFGVPRSADAPAMSGVALAVDVDGVPAVVQVSQSEDHGDVLFDTIVEDFVVEHGWIVLLFVAVLLAITFATVRGTLRPVRVASDLASRIVPGDVDARLPEAGMPREIVPLVEAVNHAIERLQKAIEVQRSFTADAAHQLRTPLAVLNLEIDRVSDAGLREQLKRDAAVLNRIVAQLLHAAQAETLALPADSTADLVEVAREVASFLAPIAVRAGVDIELLGGDGGPVPVRGHHEALVHALRNLVENAIGHAPHGTTVDIVIERPATLHVLDRGPGIPAADRANATRRFWRADRSRSGAGLGLAIVAQIAEAHGATFEIGEAPADTAGRRGAMMSLRLRSADR
jgi:signal transduction histidine kinase